jgi:glutamate dehydrogenase/leucine dehydrogenase
VSDGTNVVFNDANCPSCDQAGIVGFDAASHRRMWYACLACSGVWMGPDRTANAAGVSESGVIC